MPEITTALEALDTLGAESIGNGEVAWVKSLGESTLTGSDGSTIYLEDDWDDNALSSRSNPDDGLFPHPGANAAGDTLIGRYRPEWSVASGSPSATNGALQLSDGSTTRQTVRTPSEIVVGAYKFDWQLSSDPTTNTANSTFMAKTKGSGIRDLDGYYLTYNNNGNANDLRRDDGGTATSLISSTWADDLNTHTSKATRDAYGNFEYIFDGTSQGTATDTTYATSKYTGHGNAMDTTVAIDNLVVG